MPYSSGFEAGVGQFLQNYAAMKGLKMQQGEADDRRRAMKRADELQKVQLDQAGYDVLPMPKIERPPAQGFAQNVGRFLSDHFGGGSPEPGEIVMKTHPSQHEKDVAESEAFTTSRDAAAFGQQQAIEQLRAGIAASQERYRQGQENSRNNADNATRLQIAGMERGAQARKLDNDERDAFFDSAVEAAGGDAVQAMKNAERFQKAKAVQYHATRTDYHAAAARYRDRRAALEGRRIDIAQQNADIKAGDAQRKADILKGLGVGAPAAAAGGSQQAGPANIISSSEYRQLRAQGFTDAQIKAGGYVVR